MAVIHHAFRCRRTEDLSREITRLATLWAAGVRPRVAELANDYYRELLARPEVLDGFDLQSEICTRSWLQPEFISLRMACFLAAARGFERIPGLSTTRNSNFVVLQTTLPRIGLPLERVQLAFQGLPIETALAIPATGLNHPDLGGFLPTGGWIPGPDATEILAEVSALEAAAPDAGHANALTTLYECGALADLKTMLGAVSPDAWLVVNLVW